MAKRMTPDEPVEADGIDEPDADDMPMTGGVPDGHAQAARRNADSMNSMQTTMRRRLGKTA
jgi:hypothetical protein